MNQDNSNQSEQVADIEMDRLLTYQQNQQQNYMDYQEVSCSSSDMMSEQSLAGGMVLASSVYEPSMEMMMSHFDQMICNQQYDSGNNMLQGGETGENYHCHSESIGEVPMSVPESLVQHEDCDGLPELIEEDYSFLEDLLQEPTGDVSGSFGLMLDLDDLLSLIIMLDLQLGKPSSGIGIRFLEVLGKDEMAFDNLYCVAFQMMDAQWLAKRASYMEFNDVLKSTRAQLERELKLEDVSCVPDLPAYNLLHR
ncbi:hypothetical protein CUMW_128720 [Citrus unshiu]|nr:hypothetical protein CUMW_128720 [Citrus unshiu]